LRNLGCMREENRIHMTKRMKWEDATSTPPLIQDDPYKNSAKSRTHHSPQSVCTRGEATQVSCPTGDTDSTEFPTA
jgi:hypothetical protein